ncbi:MAG: PorV/PorQ family protein [Melioribacteraceae bacterium]|nr:PorV/PorQ family protein [Melioribacteraceae bacterium]
MKKLLVILLLAATITSAQSAGATGLSFLKLGSGARNIGIADFGSMNGNDISNYFYNPALIALNNTTRFSFTHNQQLFDLGSSSISVASNVWGLPLALNVNTTSVDNIEIRSQSGPATATFNANFFAATLGSGFKFDDNLSAGIAIKFIYEEMLNQDASGLGFDFGIVYKGFVENLSLGTSLRNIGSMSELAKESTNLPSDFRFGGEYSYPLESAKLNLIGLAGFQKYLEEDNSHIHTGLEVIYDDFFAIRGGYITGYESKSLTAGFGVQWKGFKIDYAYVPFEYGLGDNTSFTVSYTF